MKYIWQTYIPKHPADMRQRAAVFRHSLTHAQECLGTRFHTSLVYCGKHWCSHSKYDLHDKCEAARSPIKINKFSPIKKN